MGMFRVTCPHCATVSVAADVVWQRGKNGRKIVLMVCGACGLPITADVRQWDGANIDMIQTVGDLGASRCSIQQSWPAATASAAPAHTPVAVARRFVEGEEAYRRGSWNAAVSMYRSALDIATKGLDGVPKKKFYDRLIWLHENHRITPDMKDWADHVRIEGNEALHDPDDFTEEDARPLRLFTEMFLRYLFELPGEVAAFRDATPGEPAAEG